jgi:hypothetical protein
MLRKYPRTPHLVGSRLQPGDADLAAVPFTELAGQYLVVEEKLDGANAAISFGADGELLLQSRGHYLTGGPRERQFGPFKAWAATVRHVLAPILRDRYVLYGEWLYAKHTVFYDALPHYFCEFDIYDRAEDVFLSTKARQDLLAGTPIVSVPILREGEIASLAELTALVGPSTCRTPNWRDALADTARAQSLDPAQVAAETDSAEEMEGVYLKIERGGQTVGRVKWVRRSFLTSILDAGTHWMDRPILPNQLADQEALYGHL